MPASFFANDVVAGILIIVGIAVCSRIAAVFALVGSAVGALTGLALGASGVAIYNGLWGFNSFDACLAIAGVFYVLSIRSAILGVACAIATAVLFGAIAAHFGPYGLPALTLPFCFGTLAFTLMKYTTTKLIPVEPADITTPDGRHCCGAWSSSDASWLARSGGGRPEARRRDGGACRPTSRSEWGRRQLVPATWPLPIFAGASPEGMMSPSKIAVRMYRVQHALGMSTIPEILPSTGAVPRVTRACSGVNPELAHVLDRVQATPADGPRR